ncbi:MAG: thioredoxin domain-containing protein [archaeon]
MPDEVEQHSENTTPEPVLVKHETKHRVHKRAKKRHAIEKKEHRVQKKQKQPMQALPWIIIGVILLIGVIVTILLLSKTPTTTPTTNSSIPDNAEGVIMGNVNAPVTIIEYSDFQCPYSGRAAPVVNQVMDNFGDDVRLIYKHYPLSFHPNAQKAAEASECARDQGKFLEYHDILFQNQAALEVDKLKEYAVELGMQADQFNTCLDSGIKATIVGKDFEEGQAAGISGTPGFLINGQLLIGAQPYEEFAYKICDIIPDSKGCENIPQPVETQLIVLNDNTCAECNPQQLTQALQQIFRGTTITEIDYNTPAGKSLYEKYQLSLLPAYLYDTKLTEDANYAQYAQAFQKVDDKYVIIPDAAGSSYDPTAEKCTNGIDDTGNGLIDCADPQCKETMDCREAKPKQLDLFVMSQCPYGTMAMNSMKEVLQNFQGNINFKLHYIANENADGSFASLHGPAEVAEDIRELCAMNHYPDNNKYMDYIWCRNQNIQSTAWESCATDNGMDAATIKTCSEGSEGKQLLSEDLKLAQQLRIGASPTWMANNQQLFSGLDAETIKQGFCTVNAGLAGCANTLTGDAAAPAGAGCGV